VSAAPASRPAALLATLAYGALVAVLVLVACGAVGDLLARRAAVEEARARLDRMQGRGPARAGADGTPDVAAGSPFLEGPSVTVAGADLMQRVAAAVARCGGRITSSRVELEGTPYGAGFLALAASLEIGQADLQKLLYDLEAGQPFLFVDQLVAQGSAASGAGETREGGRLQVTLTVYGQWRSVR